jgi:holo-[acyl-carrier protein] synthase
MILGVGMDLFDVARLREKISRDEDFLKEILTPAEIKDCSKSSRSLDLSATKFAAKEAVFKALGTGKRGRLSWRDIEVRVDPPGVVLTGATKKACASAGVAKIHLDLATKGRYGAAVVVLEGLLKRGRKRHGV